MTVSVADGKATVTTTEGWTGVQLTTTTADNVSGKELRITFAEAAKVKAYVKYSDETDKDSIMSEASTVLYLPIDDTKTVYQVQIQPTEATTLVISEIAVNAESTKPILRPLDDGETRTLFEDEYGVVMAWNEICRMDEEWGDILESGEYFLITVKSRTEGSEWPKIILRDASSSESASVELGDVSSYPYVVKTTLTEGMVQQLRGGFCFSGDGITVTKIEICKPAAAQEGDISIESMNWMRTAVYDTELQMMTTTARWGQAGWEIGDNRYQDRTLVIVSIEPTLFPVTLKIEYENAEGRMMGHSVGIAAGKTQINLPLPLDMKIINKVYLTYAEAASIVLTDASVVSAAHARPLTGNEIVTGIRMVQDEGLIGDGSADCYDLQGRKVAGLQKGLYIMNGTKVMIK